MKTNSDDPISASAPVAFQISEKDNDKLLPIHGPGLTKREYFAAMAMQGFISSQRSTETTRELVGYAVEAADALIAELNREKGE